MGGSALARRSGLAATALAAAALATAAYPALAGAPGVDVAALTGRLRRESALVAALEGHSPVFGSLAAGPGVAVPRPGRGFEWLTASFALVVLLVRLPGVRRVV